MDQTPPLENTPLTLAQHIHQLLVASDKPMTADDLFPLLQSAQAPLKPDEKKAKAQINKILKEDSTQFFAYPKKAYWHKAPPTPAELAVSSLREAVAKLGAEDTVAEARLGKPKEKAGPEALAAFETALKEMVENNELYFVNGKYTKKRPVNAAELAVSSLREAVAKLGGEDAVADGKLGKPKAKDGPEALAAFETALKEMVEKNELYFVNGKYTKKRPLSPAELIEADISKKITGSDKLFAFEKLAPAKKNTDATAHNAELRKVVDQLLAAGKLFEHPGGKYGSFAPKKVEWYEKPAYKKAFEKTLKATRELLQIGDVTQEDFITTLQLKLQEAPPAPPVAKSKTEPAEAPAPTTPTAPAEKPATTHDLPTIIKAAYDHLRKFPEFHDGMVDLPSLFHETKNRHESLTEQQYHDAIWQLNMDKKIQLHTMNEVQLAKEKHLAIYRDDRLYYFALWN